MNLRDGALRSFAVLLAVVASYVIGPAAGAAFEVRLVEDINPGAADSFPQIGGVLNGTIIFAASRPATGRELWRSDGTKSTTSLLRDIWPGQFPSSPFGADGSLSARAGDRLFFWAKDPARGGELWITDATKQGTRMVEDIRAGPADGFVGTGESTFGEIAAAGRSVVFIADDGKHGEELWTSDGTKAGTRLLKDFVKGPLGGQPSDLAAVGNQVYFSAPTLGGGQKELWRTDGTPAGTVLIKKINPGPEGSFPWSLTPFGNIALFAATGVDGRELWRTDGTARGTRLVKDINPSGDSSPLRFTRLGDRMLFTADDGDKGTEVWRTDGTAAGTKRVFDLTAGPGDSFIERFERLGNRLLFVEATGSRELWRTDGTAAGTQRINKDFNPAGSDLIVGLTRFGRQVLFRAGGAAPADDELWRTDGTLAGTALVANINPSGPSFPGGFTVVGDKMFFGADDGSRGFELRKLLRTA